MTRTLSDAAPDVAPAAVASAFAARAAAILLAAARLLPTLEAGRQVDAAELRAAMSHAFNASDAEGAWDWKTGYQRRNGAAHKVVAVDYGLKRNILRCLTAAGCEVTVVPATAQATPMTAARAVAGVVPLN